MLTGLTMAISQDQFAAVVGISQPRVAQLIADCAADGEVERVIPQTTGYLATAGYPFPALRSVMLPMMERRGKQAKEEYRKRNAAARG